MPVWSATVARTFDGALVVGGCDVRGLADQYGTPLYVVDEADFRSRAAGFRDHFAAAFGRHGARCDVFYAPHIKVRCGSHPSQGTGAQNASMSTWRRSS